MCNFVYPGDRECLVVFLIVFDFLLGFLFQPRFLSFASPSKKGTSTIAWNQFHPTNSAAGVCH